jgi:RNA polymerase sigma-70 factor (ECF subfamily)
VRQSHTTAEEENAPPEKLSHLPRSLRSTCALVLHGLSRDEIRFALGLTDTALRKRLSDLKKSVPPQFLDHGRPIEPELDVGLIRQALSRWVRIASGVGLSDPDGHLIVANFPDFPKHPSQKPPRRQQKG